MDNEGPQMPPEHANILMHQDVQKFLWVLNGVLDGTKKLVIESNHFNGGGVPTSSRMAHRSVHTFKVVDATPG